MKIILTILVFLFTVQANETVEIGDEQYQKEIKKYFKTNAKLGIPIEKRSLRSYYKKNNYHLLWTKNNILNPIHTDLISHVNNDKITSINSFKYYNMEKLNSLLQLNSQERNVTKSISFKDTIRLDLLLTNLYDVHMNNQMQGSINWKEFTSQLRELKKHRDINAKWEKRYHKVKKIDLLKESLLNEDINIAINKTKSENKKVDLLYEAIQKYEKVAQEGGFTKIPKIRKSLKPFNKSNTIPFLRARMIEYNNFVNIEQNLSVEVDTNTSNNKIVYDKNLVEAVKNYQKNNGLYIDGVIGQNTAKHLNITAEQKINTIKLNIERLRWLPKDMGPKYIMVNIPDYNLKYYNDSNLTMTLPVIVGTKRHPTPIFSHSLSQIVLNPYWRVPPSIVKKELIPKLVKDSAYIKRLGMNIHQTWDSNSTTFDSNDIFWKEYSQTEEQKIKKEYTDVPFRFIQIPGSKNPLGKIKFLFPNKYSVYLHDTNQRHLFKRNTRSYSHGCIRLQTPMKLLKEISKEDKNVNYKKSMTILKDIEKTRLGLRKNIPIHIVYLTSWIDENNQLQFRNDIYGYDKMQNKLMYQVYNVKAAKWKRISRAKAKKKRDLKKLEKLAIKEENIEKVELVEN